MSHICDARYLLVYFLEYIRMSLFVFFSLHVQTSIHPKRSVPLGAYAVNASLPNLELVEILQRSDSSSNRDKTSYSRIFELTMMPRKKAHLKLYALIKCCKIFHSSDTEFMENERVPIINCTRWKYDKTLHSHFSANDFFLFYIMLSLVYTSWKTFTVKCLFLMFKVKDK